MGLRWRAVYKCTDTYSRRWAAVGHHCRLRQRTGPGRRNTRGVSRGICVHVPMCPPELARVCGLHRVCCDRLAAWKLNIEQAATRLTARDVGRAGAALFSLCATRRDCSSISHT